MTTLWQDVRYGLRMIARNPGFTAVVVVILAIGIGANTALFSVVNAVMLRPLPYKDSQRLVRVWDRGVWHDEGFRSRPHFLFLRENNQVFESLAGWCGRRFYVSGIEKPHVANLFLARAAVRRREMAMRLALGASRWRVICQMLTESFLLSLGAGLAGLLLTFLAIKGLVRLCPSDTPRLQETSVDLPVLGFMLGVSVLTGLLFGMMPAWRASDIADALASRSKYGSGFTIASRPDPERDNMARWVSVTPIYFDTIGIRLLRGQTLPDREPNALVIDEMPAKQYFPDSDPIGQRLITDGHSEHTIVGVVETVRSFETPVPVKGTIYERVEEFSGETVLLIATDGDPMRLDQAVRIEVAELEADRVIRQLEPLETTLSRMLVPRRFVMILLTLFAGIALILASVGIYGLLQYSTTQQTRDIGIRIALGARKVDILRAILKHGFKLTLIGVIIGLAGAVALTRILSNLLYDVTPTDPLTLAGVSVLLAVIALLASYIPARRAARIDPMVALRYE